VCDCSGRVRAMRGLRCGMGGGPVDCKDDPDTDNIGDGERAEGIASEGVLLVLFTNMC